MGIIKDFVSAFKRALTPCMASFHAYFPEVAARETRTAIVRSHPSLPSGEYTFRELYCVRKGCDCRNVILSVCDKTGRTLATLNHSLDPDGFKDIGKERTFLDRINVQSKHSPSLLDLFESSVLDKAYAKRLERHWRMVKGKVHGRAYTARPRTAAPAYLTAMRDEMDEWPESWKGVGADAASGKALVEAFEPFLFWMSDKGLSRRTIARHVDNMWLLGGEIIRRMNHDAALRRLPAEAAIRACVDEEGGPLALGEDEAGQRDLDATCRKLHRFLIARAQSSRSPAA